MNIKVQNARNKLYLGLKKMYSENSRQNAQGNVTHPDKKGHKSKHLYDYEIMKSNTKIPGKLKSHLDFKVHKLTNGDDDRHGQL